MRYLSTLTGIKGSKTYLEQQLGTAEGLTRQLIILSLANQDEKQMRGEVLKIINETDSGFIRTMAVNSLAHIGEAGDIKLLTQIQKSDTFKRSYQAHMEASVRDHYPVRQAAQDAIKNIESRIKLENELTGELFLDRQSWGEPLNGLRMRVSAPMGTEYRQGMRLPLFLEIQNISHQPIPLNKLFNPLSFKVTDQDNNRIGVQGYLYNHITRWEGAAENLEPGEIINDTVYFERLRFKVPPGRESVALHFQLPTQKENPGKLPINSYPGFPR